MRIRLRDLVAGAVAGAVATYVMTELGAMVLEHVQSARTRRKEDRVEPWRPISRLVRRACGLCGIRLNQRQADAGGEIAHWLIGCANGIVYAMMVRRRPSLRRLCGLQNGLAMLAMDEVFSPIAGIAPPPQEFPIATHLRAVFNHVVFALSLAAAFELLDGPA